MFLILYPFVVLIRGEKRQSRAEIRKTCRERRKIRMEREREHVREEEEQIWKEDEYVWKGDEQSLLSRGPDLRLKQMAYGYCQSPAEFLSLERALILYNLVCANMKYIRAKAGFIRYADEKLVVTASWIIQCMKQSDIFVDPTPPIARIEEAYNDYYQKVVQSVGGSRLVKIQKRESKKILSDLLQKLVFYVNVVSDGDLVKLYSSGFPVLAGKQKGQAPNTPGDPFLRDGRRSGEVAFGFQPVGRDMLYDYCFATEVDDNNQPLWGEEQTTSRSFKAYQDGFKPGQYIYFRVRARNKHGCSSWTTTVMFMVR